MDGRPNRRKKSCVFKFLRRGLKFIHSSRNSVIGYKQRFLGYIKAETQVIVEKLFLHDSLNGYNFPAIGENAKK